MEAQPGNNAVGHPLYHENQAHVAIALKRWDPELTLEVGYNIYKRYYFHDDTMYLTFICVQEAVYLVFQILPEGLDGSPLVSSTLRKRELLVPIEFLFCAYIINQYQLRTMKDTSTDN